MRTRGLWTILSAGVCALAISARPAMAQETIPATVVAPNPPPVQTQNQSAPTASARSPDGDAPAATGMQNGGGTAYFGSGFDNLEFVDPSLHAKLTILRVGSEPTVNNLLAVFAGMKNKTARRLDLEVQTIYKDKSGNPLNSGSWIPFSLKAHQESEYRSAAISDGAVDFLIRIRRAGSASP